MGRRKKVDMPAVENVALSTPVTDQDITTLLTEWKNAVDTLKEVKDKEQGLRQLLVVQLFNGEKLEGTESVDLGWQGWQLRCEKNLNYSATNKNGEMLAALNLLGAVDPALATGLVSWSPDIHKKEYRAALEIAKANPELLAAFTAAITVKPGMPSLELVPPKQ